MRTSTFLQNRISSILALAVLASSAAAWPSQCMADAGARCGGINEKAFVRCIVSRTSAWFTVSAVRTCLSESGCSEQDAEAQARWAVDVCGSQYDELGNRLGGAKFTAEELRKRDTTTTGSSETTTTAETTTTTEKSSTSQTSTTSSSATTATTTTTDGTSTSTTASTVSSTSSVSSSSGSTSSYNTSCYTTITYTTDGWDVVASSSGRVSRTWNSSMLAATSKCKDGYYCSTDGCFVASNEIQGTGGIIVTAIFAASGALALGILVMLCCRDRRKDKKLKAQAEAAKIAKEQAAAAAVTKPAIIGKRVGSSARRSPSPLTDTQPLIGAD